MKKETTNQIKVYFLALFLAVSAMVLIVSTINLTKHSLSGRAFFSPIEIEGEVRPELPDGTEIIFKIDDLVIAEDELKDGWYGRLMLMMDDPSTTVKEGYANGDIVTVYIEDIEVAEFSYFEEVNEKNIIIPGKERAEITRRAVLSSLQCVPLWSCEEWSECVNGVQTRECTDSRECGEDSPSTEIVCITENAPVEQPLPAEPGKGIQWEIVIASVVLFAALIVMIYTIGEKQDARKVKK